MHEAIYRRALRSGMTWVIAGIVVPTAILATSAGLLTGTLGAIFAAITFPLVYSLYVLHGWTVFSQWSLPVSQAQPPNKELQDIVDGISIALGKSSLKACIIENEAPNVACLTGGRGGDLLVVTNRLGQILTRDELESVCAAQWALSSDRWCGIFRRAVAAHCLMGVLTIFFFAAIISDPLVYVGVAGFLSIVIGSRIRWWAQVLSDAVCVRTTRYPVPLMHALRKLALYNGKQMQTIWPWFAAVGAADTYWLVPVSNSANYISAVLNYSREIRIQGEEGSDTELIVRASILHRSLTHSLKSSDWKRAQRLVSMAEAAEEHGRTINVGGLVVGPNGARLPLHKQPLHPLKVFKGEPFDQT